MKKAILGLALTAFLSTPVLAADFIINSSKFQYSSNYKQILLKSPLVNMKQGMNTMKMGPISVDQFVTFWNTKEKGSGFDKVQPNAILSSWDEDNNYLESTFIIHGARKTADGLMLNVTYLSNPEEHIAPVSINSKPAELSDLQKFIDGTDNAAVTVLVDCFFLDGRC